MSRINKQLEPICGPDDYDAHDRRRESFESPEQILKNTIIKLGEVVSPVSYQLLLSPTLMTGCFRTPSKNCRDWRNKSVNRCHFRCQSYLKAFG